MPKKIKKRLKSVETGHNHQADIVHEDDVGFDVYYNEEAKELVFYIRLRKAWGDPIDYDFEEVFGPEDVDGLLDFIKSVSEEMKKDKVEDKVDEVDEKDENEGV